MTDEEWATLSDTQKKATLTTRERAKTLWADGYQIAPTKARMVFTVTAPEKLVKTTGELRQERYTVDALAPSCTCQQYANCGECKHLIAVQARVQEAIALLTPTPVQSCAGLEAVSGTSAYTHARVREFPQTPSTMHYPAKEEKEKPKEAVTGGGVYRRCSNCGHLAQGVCSRCIATVMVTRAETTGSAAPVRTNRAQDFG